MTNGNLIQCECGGWMNPKAIICPTCGYVGPKGKHLLPKSKFGWEVVKAFYTLVFAGIIVALIFG